MQILGLRTLLPPPYIPGRQANVGDQTLLQASQLPMIMDCLLVWDETLVHTLALVSDQMLLLAQVLVRGRMLHRRLMLSCGPMLAKSLLLAWQWTSWMEKETVRSRCLCAAPARRLMAEGSAGKCRKKM